MFTPSQYNSLPGLPFPQPPDTLATKDEVADYLDLYARTFNLPVRLGARVEAVEKKSSGYLVRADAATYEARQVVISTGACLSVEFTASHGRPPDRQELITAYYGVPVPDLSLYIGYT